MAVLKINDRQVTVLLDWWEKLAARRSHLTLPPRAITAVEVVEDACAVASTRDSLRRAPGTRIRGLTNTGTFTAADGTRASTFSVCHGAGPGIILELDSVTVNRIIISTPKARDYAHELSRVVG